jgi:hypothetical protein
MADAYWTLLLGVFLAGFCGMTLLRPSIFFREYTPGISRSRRLLNGWILIVLVAAMAIGGLVTIYVALKQLGFLH